MDSLRLKAQRLDGMLAQLEFKIARLHLRDDLTVKRRNQQVFKARRKLIRYLDAWDALLRPDQ